MISVLKFGGTSVGDITKVVSIARYLVDRSKKGEKLVVVVSAMNKTTDELKFLASQVHSKPQGRELDRLLSIGEQQTISLLAMSCDSMGVKTISLTAPQLKIMSDSTFNNAKISSLKKENVTKYFEDYDILVVAGFQGINEKDEVTTLGRGGSDTSAVALASVLSTTCEIYTDVDGIYATDPRIFKNARKLKEISFDEMGELASLGAGVMHNRSINLAKKYNTPIYVAKSLTREKGTYIMKEVSEENIVSAITKDESIINVTITSKESNILKEVADRNINIDMVSQVYLDNQFITAFSTSVDNKELLEPFSEEKNITLNEDLCKISLVGLGMREASGVMQKVYDVLTHLNIEIYQVSTSEITISLLVSKEKADEVIIKLCQEFDLEER